jgi:two-component system OmpR family response regulator
MSDNLTGKKILIVDDDHDIRDLLGKFLQQHGFNTLLAQDGIEMFDRLLQNPVDLIILDIMMPGDDGLTLCRKLRSESSIPIIMLTAIGEEIDRIVGLEMGADDYISKPFNPRELLARIKAILRRSNAHAITKEDEITTVHTLYHFSEWQLNLTTRILLSPEKSDTTLSSGEFDLLLAFLERPQQILSRDALLDLTKNRSAGPFDRSIDIQISRLRHKVEENPKMPRLIKTVRGGGYVLSTSVKRSQETTA